MNWSSSAVQTETTVPLSFLLCSLHFWQHQRAHMAVACWWEPSELLRATPQLCSQGRADTERSFCHTVIFSQMKPTAAGCFPPLCRCTESCQKEGEDGAGEAANQSSQHSAAQSRPRQHRQRAVSLPDLPGCMLLGFPGASPAHRPCTCPPSTTYLSAPSPRLPLKRSSEVRESTQGPPARAPLRVHTD